jgi:hypothetical protein
LKLKKQRLALNEWVVNFKNVAWANPDSGEAITHQLTPLERELEVLNETLKKMAEEEEAVIGEV